MQIRLLISIVNINVLNSTGCGMLLRTILLALLLHLGSSNSQEINIGIPYLPAAYDPHDSQVVYTQRVLGDLYEGLIAEAADGTLIPGMAESWEQSKDGLKYTFNIRKNAKWSDGKPVSANDFLLSLQRLFVEKGADLERFLVIAGSDGWSEGKEIGIKVLDSNTLQFTLSKPYPLFLQLMASASAYPIPSHIWGKVKKDYFKPEHAVTNGAYAFHPTIKPTKNKLSLISNVFYWDHKNVKIHSANYYGSSNTANATRNFSSGEYDVLYEFEGYQFKMLNKQFPKSIRNVAQLNGYYVLFNHNVAAFKNHAVREAMSLAIDRERFVKTTDTQNMRPLNTVVPPIRNYLSRAKLGVNIAKAKQLMASAGYNKSNPLKVSFIAVDSKQDKRILSFLRHGWMAINVHLDIKFYKFKDYVNALYKNEFELSRLSWFAGVEDAYDFLSIYQSTEKSNFGQFNSEKFDQLLNVSLTELDKTKRSKAMSDAEFIMISEVANVPLFSANILSLVHPRVKGWVDNATNTHRIRWLSIE